MSYIETQTSRGFALITDQEGARILQASSSIGDYDDAMDNPGSSAIWYGDTEYNREEALALATMLPAVLAEYVTHWHRTGQFVWLEHWGPKPK